jgi:hypothetical protein
MPTVRNLSKSSSSARPWFVAALIKSIQKPIGIYAKAPGIRIVFRHGGTHHGTAPAEIIQSLQAAIVYHDGLDITAEIIKWLKAASADPQ